MSRAAAVVRDDERLLGGDEAIAWLEAGQDHRVRGKTWLGAATDARLAVQDGWLLVTSPRSSRADRAADAAERAAIVNVVEREVWTPPAWRRGEVCHAVQCPWCGHRLAPRSLAARVTHDARRCPRLVTAVTTTGRPGWPRLPGEASPAQATP